MQELPISKRRGFEFSEFAVNTIGILMVKAPIQEVSPVIAELLNGTLATNIFGKKSDSNLGRQFLLYQYRVHDWTIIFTFDICAESTVSKISQLLKTRCIYLQYGDTSGSYSYSLFETGKCTEEFQWGCDYTQEYLEIDRKDLWQFAEERENQGDPLSSNWDPRQWNVYCFEDLRSYKFRSHTRTASEVEVLNTDKFLNTLFCAQDAWLPSWEYIPCRDDLSNSSLKADDFVRVDCIQDAKSVNEALAMINEYQQGNFG